MCYVVLGCDHSSIAAHACKEKFLAEFRRNLAIFGSEDDLCWRYPEVVWLNAAYGLQAHRAQVLRYLLVLPFKTLHWAQFVVHQFRFQALLPGNLALVLVGFVEKTATGAVRPLRVTPQVKVMHG